MTGDPEHHRPIRKMIERLEAFRLSCKQLEANAEEFEKFLVEELERDEK